jgi:flagellar protein FlgJ
MQISSPAQIKTANLPLEKLAGNPHLAESDKIAEASRQFEAILLRQILSNAQKPLFQSTVVPNSVSRDIYRDVATQELADQISRSRSFGLARALENQLQHQLKPTDAGQASDAPTVSGACSCPRLNG